MEVGLRNKDTEPPYFFFEPMTKVQVKEYRGYTIEPSRLFFNVFREDGTYCCCRSMMQAKKYIDALIDLGEDAANEVLKGNWKKV